MEYLNKNEIILLNDLFFEGKYNSLANYDKLKEIDNKYIVKETWSRDTGHMWKEICLYKPNHTKEDFEYVSLNKSEKLIISNLTIENQIIFWEKIKEEAILIKLENEIGKVFNYVEKLFKQKNDKKLTYHNWEHTKYVFDRLKGICIANSFSWNKTEEMLTAALFHDVGYLFEYDNHEDKSIEIAENFMKEFNKSETFIKNVSEMIYTTKADAIPIPDSDFHLLKDIDLEYRIIDQEKRSMELKKESENILNINYTDEEWLNIQNSFFSNIKFYSWYGKENIGDVNNYL